MIVELIGPMAVGKTTVAPLVADRLDIAHYQGQAFHGLDNEPLTGWQLSADRVVSVVRNPRLFVGTLRAHNGSAKERFGFALNICRRDRFAAMASAGADGVVASGPVHALCQLSAWIREDMTALAPLITRADIYVWLYADAAEVTRRLSTRKEFPLQYVAEHEDWIDRYDDAVTRMLARLDRPVIDVSADADPTVVADEIASRLANRFEVETGAGG
jgi:shikimate kinase